MSKHLNDLSAVYLSQIAEETVCPVCGFNPCQCLEGTLDESCGCDHETPKSKTQVAQAKAAEKYSGKKLRDLPGRKKVDEGAVALPVARMITQSGNKDVRASKEKDAKKREKLETQARTIRTTVDMDAFKKTKGMRTEGFSDWRNDLIEVVGADIPSSQAQKDTEMKGEIKDKKVRNKVVINPPLGEEIKAMGGTILEMMEYDDEFDYILESVYDELIEEGFSEDEVEFGIESALTTLDEGYYDSATETSKSNAANVKTTQFTAKKKAQGSIKDRLKSAAKKAIVGAGRAVAKAANTADAVKSAPGRAAKKVSSAVARVKGLAKSGYESERKSGDSTYRGKGVGRKEKIGEDVERLDEMPYQVMGSPDGKKEKKIGKPVKSKKYADARASELADTHKATGGKYRSQYVEDVEQVDEKLNLKKADMGDVVTDFYKSDAPQFKGKSKEKRREMAVAAKLGAMREEKKPEVEAQGKKVAGYEKADKYKGIVARFRKENPGSRQPKKVRGAKPTEGELSQQRIQAANKRISKHGLTSREKKETQARAKYDSPRD
jgi:hypothetical protein